MGFLILLVVPSLCCVKSMLDWLLLECRLGVSGFCITPAKIQVHESSRIHGTAIPSLYVPWEVVSPCLSLSFDQRRGEQLWHLLHDEDPPPLRKWYCIVLFYRGKGNTCLPRRAQVWACCLLNLVVYWEVTFQFWCMLQFSVLVRCAGGKSLHLIHASMLLLLLWIY